MDVSNLTKNCFGLEYLFVEFLLLLFSYVGVLMCFVMCLEFALTHVDEVIDELLTKDYSCDIALPRIKKR